MPIVYSALIPHQPLLIPTIGNNTYNHLPLTYDGINQARTLIQESQSETIVIITTPDTTRAQERIIIKAPTQYRGTFETFGDLTTIVDPECDTVLAQQLKKDLEEASWPISFDSDPVMDYSAAVPFLLMNQPSCKCVVIHPPFCDLKRLLALGEQIHSTLQRSEKRIACIASGDLSHCLTESSPQKYNLEGTIIDQNIVLLFKSRRLPIRKLIALPRDAALECGVCGLDAFTVLAGIIHHMNYKTRFHSYEGTIGVGLLVVSYLF